MKSPVPDDLELRPEVTMEDLLETLTRHTNQLIFGRDERGNENEPGEPSPFRAVVIVGGLITSTLLGLGVTPTVFYTFGRKAAAKAIEREAPASH